jgi:hypothetical protein
MRAFKFGLAALAMAFAVSACSAKSGAIAPVKTTPAELEKHVEKLAAEPFKTDAKGAADLASVRDALPKAISLTWASLDFDAATGATVLKDVKLTPADKPEIGIGISELRVWNFNTDIATARLQGQRLAETGDLARRIEATSLSIFGLDKVIAPAMNAYTSSMTDMIASGASPEVADRLAASYQTTLQDYELSIGKLVFDDVKLRPYELKLAQLPPDSEFAEAMPMIQTWAAVSRSFGVDTMFMRQFTGRLAMTTAGQEMKMTFTADAYGIRGMRGSDMDAAFMRGLAFDMDAPMGMADAAAGTAVPVMKMAGGVDYVSMEGMRLDKVAGYLAKGEWPPRTEADLMSYGLINVKNEHVAINGHDVYSVGEVVVDARKWHWFIPTKVSIKTNDIVYDVKALMDFASEMERATSSGAPEETSPDGAAEPSSGPASLIDPAIMQLLTKYGLDKPSLDFALGWDWNPTSGAAVVTTGFGLDNYMRTDLKYEGGFPTFKGVSDLIPGGFETAKGEEIGALFQKASTLKMVELNVVDEGGLDKMFALAAEAGKMMPPDQTGGVAVFANATPASLRQMASAGVYMAADQAAAMASGLKEMIVPFGTFIEKGGRVQFTLKPKTPVVLASLEERTDIRTGQVSPAQLLVEWNGKTVHTPPSPVKP